ncbi:MAG: short chain dehydrogenase [Salinisphaeraceae bacterium]|jgi:short-subunit dehydrogenase|nr:short chain dehydrogenase [Salinisphaeraceae bacterium]
MNLLDKNVLVTGATGGIGLSLVRRLGSAGARLLLTGRQEQPLRRLVDELAAASVRADFVVADLNTADDRRALAQAAEKWRGGPDVVIHNAGSNHAGSFQNLSPAALEAMITANLTAPMDLTRLLLPGLKSKREATLLFVGSGFGRVAYPGFAAYSATKFGLRGFAEALRRELADTTVRVALLAPRAVDTGMNGSRVRALQADLHMKVDSPDKVADAAINMLETGQTEHGLGWQERLFSRVNGLTPGLVDGVLRKQLPTIRRRLDH